MSLSLNPLSNPFLEGNNASQYRFSQTESYLPKQSSQQGTELLRYEYSRGTAAYSVSLGSQDSDQSLTYSQIKYESTNRYSGLVEDVDSVSLETTPLLDGASNILNFIEARVMKEAAMGTSEGELRQLIEQGLSGFKEGYSQAEAVLSRSGQLNDIVQGTIDILYEQVMEGFDSLKERYTDQMTSQPDRGDKSEESIKNEPASVIPFIPQGSVKTANVTRFIFFSSTQSNFVQVSGANGSNQSSSDLRRSVITSSIEDLLEQDLSLEPIDSDKEPVAVANDQVDRSTGNVIAAAIEYGRKDRFEFELTTLDGDTVSINATNIFAFYGEYYSDNESLGSEVLEGAKEKSRFSMEINGELDDEERAAMDQLLGQVMDLADEFYNGNMNKAYEAALNLGYDDSEIATYSIRLKQVEQVSVTTAYNAFMPSSDAALSPAIDILSTISDYARDIIESLENPENYALFDYSELLSIVSRQIDKQIDTEDKPTFSSAVDSIITGLRANAAFRVLT